ncbi:MAG: hypothetical protein ACR2JC_07800 [Chloroflexota bacterium]|nr:MAG: hypothetical protein DLM70_02730 [Chloroflexota bacterium]
MQIKTSTLAEIVQALIQGRPGRAHDPTWVQERADEAGLDPHDSAALEALHLRLRDGTALLTGWTKSGWF